MALTFFSWIDYTIFFTLTGLGCVFGVYFGFYKKENILQNYFNGENLKWFPVAMSLVSSALTGFSLLGYPTEVYMYGTQISLILLPVLISALINYFVFLPVFFKLQLSHVYQYLKLRYNNYLKNAFTLVYMIKTVFVLPMLMYIPSIIFSQGVNSHIVAPIMILICIFYTVVGGMKAVIWADTLQFAVTIFTLTYVITLAVITIGGFNVVLERIQAGDRWEFFNFNLDPTIRSTFWSVVVGNLFTSTANVSVTAPAVQRYLSLSSMQVVKKALIMFIVVLMIMKLVCFLMGVIMYSNYYDCDPKSIGEIKKFDQIVPYFIAEVTQGFKGLNGLFVAASFGVAFSTYSTALNTFASIFYTDHIHARLSNKHLVQRKQLIIPKSITFIIGISSIGLIYLVENVGTIFEVNLYLKGATDGATLGVFLMGLIVPFANVKGATAGSISSIILMGVIIIRTQIYVWNGIIKPNPKPLHTYGCNLTNFSTLLTSTPASLTTLLPNVNLQDNPPWLFRISFQYYTFIGTMCTVCVGVIVSWFTRKKTDEEVNPSYISPFVHKIITKLRKQEIAYPTEDTLLGEPTLNRK